MMQNFNAFDFVNLQLDTRIFDSRSEEQLQKHALDGISDHNDVERAYHILTKGEDVQKISVIHSLPSLLEGDSQGCLTRLIPKMQQTLPTASTEFHLAASSTFKNILEQNLVSYSIFTRTFLQSILNSLESRDPVISRAWLETLLDVIELLPVDIIREEILPQAINKGQLKETVASRVICCKLVGKICTRFDSVLIKKEVLPTVHSLCQDVSSDVRACICLKLHHVAKNLDPESVMSALLPSLVELASDEESNVRFASVQAIVDLLPHLQEETKKSTIIPLVKKLFEIALKSDDDVILIISEIFGKFALEIEKSLNKTEFFWFVQYFQQLAQLGISCVKKETAQVEFFPFDGTNSVFSEKYVQVRQNCANNIPSMMIFIVSMTGDVNVLLPTFCDLANDPYFVVRKSIACIIHEVAIVLDSRSGLIKTEFINLLKCDVNEVVHGLVPHLGQMLMLLARSKTIGTEQVDSTVTELGKALIKCESEISRTNNWRLAETMMDQLQVLPKCFSSDYIYTNFVPLAMDRVLNARPIPVRLAAGKTLLVFLRYNLKSLQRTELRNKIHTELARSQNCYTRMLFTRVMNEALSLFSSVYFKEHFFSTLLSMTEDPVANIRLKVVTVLPTLKTLIQLPTDKKLLVALETNVRHLMNSEKDKDVVSALMQVTQKLNDIEVKHEGQAISGSMNRLETDDLIKYEEEQKLENMAAGSSVKKVFRAPKTAGPKRISFGEASTSKSGKNETEIVSSSMSPPLAKIKQSADTMKSSEIKTNSTAAKQAFDPTKSSTSSNNLTSNWARLASNSMLLEHPWERMGPSDSDKLENKSYSPYVTHDPCNCYKTSYIFQPQFVPSKSSDQEPKELSCRSCLDYSEYLRSRNLRYRHDSNPTSDFAKSLLLTHLDEDKHECLQDFLLTRDDIDGGGNKTPDLVALQALTNVAHYNSCWAFSSMPELPVTFLDDEFIIDAGIRIPSQLSTSQSTSKIPNLQDIIYRNKGTNADRSRRYSGCGISDFQKGKPKSQEYKDSTKPISSVYLPANTHYKNEMRRPWHSEEQQLAQSSKCNKYSGSKTKSDFEMSQEKTYDGMKRNSAIISRSKTKPPQPRSLPDRSKRHSANYAIKIPDSRDAKPNFKRHSMEVTDHAPVERRALRRYSTFDVNHNQGPSKIPLRSFQSGSRTAPATRASSPIRAEARLCFQRSASQQGNTQSSSQERRLRRFTSSDEEVDKLCQKLLYSQTAPCSRASSPKSKDSRLPIRLQREKL